MVQAIAILPARGGSKRIPRKNIKRFFGRPAISWPLETILQSGLFARTIVSTDDEEIAMIAREYGAEVPFLRNGRLSDDHTGTTEVVRDAVKRLELENDICVCCVYPTALFLRKEDLVEGLEYLQAGANWVISVSEYATPIDRAYRHENGKLLPRDPSSMPKRSQDLEPSYFDAGQFYWALTQTWLDKKAKVWDGAAGVTLPLERAIDIDTLDDWKRAEYMARFLGM